MHNPIHLSIDELAAQCRQESEQIKKKLVAAAQCKLGAISPVLATYLIHQVSCA